MVIANDIDYSLVKSFHNGNQNESFDLLLRKYQDKVYNFCFRFLGNKDDAFDCSQEIFIKVFQHLNGFEFRSLFSTWLYKITINTCKDMSKARSNKQKSLIRLNLNQINDKSGILSESKSTSPENLLSRKELNLAFQRALNRLRRKSRMLIIMRDIEGKTYEEISSITGFRPGTVRSTIARARYQIAGELKAYRYEM